MPNFYKSLRICVSKELKNEIAFFYAKLINSVIPKLINLKELHCYIDELDIETLAQLSTKLERMNFHNTLFDFNKILPLFRHLKRLTAVQLNRLDDEVLELVKLNREREELGAKRSVIIYVRKSIYLETKWATKNLNLKLVEIARIERIDRNIWLNNNDSQRNFIKRIVI